MAFVQVSFDLNGKTVQADLRSKALGYSYSDMAGAKAAIKLLDSDDIWVWGDDKFTLKGFLVSRCDSLCDDGSNVQNFVKPEALHADHLPFLQAICLTDPFYTRKPEKFISPAILPVSIVRIAKKE